MEDQASLSQNGSGLHIDEDAARNACMAFPASIRAKVSNALQENHERWSETSWARRLQLVQAAAQAEAASLRTPKLPDEAALARCNLFALFILWHSKSASYDSPIPIEAE
jgi:hypothetical protein